MSEINWEEVIKKYQSLGWTIIPIGHNKKPLIPWKEFQTRQPSELEIHEWVKNLPINGIAVVTGKQSNLAVLDIDIGSTFDLTGIPETASSKTGSGGTHLFFTYPESKDLGNLTAFQPNTDLRAEGGYVILPPSKHPNGLNYSWIHEPFDISLATIPESLLNELLKAKNTPHIIEQSGVSIYSGVKQSMRNDSATRVIGLILNKFPESEWDTEGYKLFKAWNTQNDPPLDEFELKTVFNSIKKKELESDSSKLENKSSSQLLIELILESNLKLYSDQFGEAHLSVPECTFVGYKLSSDIVDNLFSRLFWDTYHKPIGLNSVRTAISTLQGIIQKDRPSYTLHNRIGAYQNRLYYDLGDNRRVVEITPGGWRVTSECPIFFYRYRHQKIQATPQNGGDLKELLKYVNTPNKLHQLLILTHTCVSCFPDIPRAILVLYGDQGSAKSTLLKLIRSLIDPSETPLLSEPDNPREFVQHASHHYCLYLDNLSKISIWLSDSLCRAISGEGYSKRKLYSDDDDILYSYKRAVGLCSISQVAVKPDLLDRSILISLERISDSQRRDERSFWQEFNERKPFLLGALFDVLAICLGNNDPIQSGYHPRMADHFQYAYKAAEALGYTGSQLTQAFQANTVQQQEEALDASSVAQTIIRFMEFHDSWEGTSAQLYTELVKIAEFLEIKQSFPKSASWLWRKITDVRANLIAVGITPTKDHQSDANHISLKKNASTKTESSESPSPENENTDGNGSVNE